MGTGSVIDQSEIGRVVANMMDTIEHDVETGELPADVEITRCMVEANFTDEDGDQASGVRVEITDISNVIGLGLTARAYGALTQ